MSSDTTSKRHNDSDYCKEIAKRAVARAALHLGVESMNADALEVMGDALVSYLDTFGRVLAANVESSRRSSAHCNILDALQTVELCTASAAHQIQNTQEEASRDEVQSYNGQDRIGRGWRSLASFLFGPNWLDISLCEEGVNTQAKLGQQGPTATQTTNNHKDTSGNGEMSIIKNRGWDAPYSDPIQTFPILGGNKAHPNSYLQFIGDSFHDIYAPEEEACNGDSLIIGRGHIHKSVKRIPFDSSFLSDCHDPSIHPDYIHKFSYAHKLEEDAELRFSQIPDELFYESGVTSFWGSLEQQNLLDERNKSSNMLPSRMESVINGSDSEKYGLFIPSAPIAGKRVRFDERYEDNFNGISKKSRTDSHRPAYLPKFLPMFPPEKTYSNNLDDKSLSSMSQSKDDTQLSVVNIPVGGTSSKQLLSQTLHQTTAQHSYKYDQESTVAVRQSLVSMERSIGSSLWGSIQGRVGEDIISNTQTNGPSTFSDSIITDISVPRGLPNPEQGIAPKAHAAVIPLGRASNSRVSRIIEGSLDAVIQ